MLIDNLPVLSEGHIFTTGTACSEDRYAHAARTDPANKMRDAENASPCVQRVHNSPECRVYRWSIRMSKAQICCSERKSERDIIRPPAPVQIKPELPTATAFYSEM